MLNYNEYTSCLDTRLYKSGREIGVTSHRRRDSQCGDDKVFPSPLLPHSQLRPANVLHFSSSRTPFILITSVSFSTIENRAFGDHFDIHLVASGTKQFEIYSLFFSGFVYGENLCVIDSRQCYLSHVRNRFNPSSPFSRFNLYYLASAKVLLAIGTAD